jgi:two-component system, NarL family, sensor kinase
MKPVFFLLACFLVLAARAQDDTALYNQAKLFYEASKPDSAIVMLNKLIAKKNVAYKLRSDVYDMLGHIELDKGNLPGALAFYLESERTGIANNDIDVTTKAAVNISGIYREQNNLEVAREYIDKAEKDIDKVVSPKVAGSFYNNKGILLEMGNLFDSAIETYNKALAIYISVKDSNRIAVGYNNLGVVYKNKGDYEMALRNYQKVVDIEKIIGNKYILGATYINIGSVNHQLKKYNDAIAYNRLGLSIAKEVPAQYLIVSAAENIADAFFEMKLMDSAYTWQKIRFAENEKYLNAENSSQINEMQAKYETVKKEQVIALQQSKLSRQRIFMMGGAALCALMLLSAYLLYRRYKLKKEKELQEKLMLQREEATINILTAEEKERKRIAAELHDGVGQLMTAAWLNLQVLEKQFGQGSGEQQQLLGKTTLLVGESCKEVRQVSHNMVPNALLKKGLVDAIKEFTLQIDRSVISINMQADGLDTELDSITETVLYRVIQECVNNTVKHAHATELDISIHHAESGIDILIEDNGKGFDTSLVKENENGLGLQNIRSRISFLKGTVHWDSSPGNGTVVAIHIPPKKP